MGDKNLNQTKPKHKRRVRDLQTSQFNLSYQE